MPSMQVLEQAEVDPGLQLPDIDAVMREVTEMFVKEYQATHGTKAFDPNRRLSLFLYEHFQVTSSLAAASPSGNGLRC